MPEPTEVSPTTKPQSRRSGPPAPCRAASGGTRRRSSCAATNVFTAKPRPPAISAPPTTLAHRRLRAVAERARDLRRRRATAAPSRQHPERERDVHVAELRWRQAPNDLKIAPWRMSVPTAVFGSKPKSRISIGVIRLPPPMPVMPTRIPTRSPASDELPGHASRGSGGSGQETNGRPVSRQRELVAPRSRCRSRWPAASRASAATSERRAQAPSGGAARRVREPDAAASTTRPTMFAARGGRASSSGPSPNRGWISSKYATHGRQNRRPNVEPDGQLQRQQREQPPPAGRDREHGDVPIDGLVRPRRARVDHREVAVRVRRAASRVASTTMPAPTVSFVASSIEDERARRAVARVRDRPPAARRAGAGRRRDR